MSESVIIPMDDKYSIEYKPTGYRSRVGWVLRRKITVRPPEPGANEATIISLAYSGQGHNPEAAKKQAERAYHEALEQERTEAKVIEELRGFGNQ